MLLVSVVYSVGCGRNVQLSQFQASPDLPLGNSPALAVGL
jgi:hypothetical protein